MLDKKNNNIYTKQEIRKFVIALLPILIVSIIYYVHIRQEALKSVERKAESTLRQTENSINNHLETIEIIVDALRPMAEYALDNPDAMYDIACHTVESSPNIMGANIAFKADYYPEIGHWFETYVGYQKGCDTLVTKQIGCAEHNYLEMDWFKKGMKSAQGFWSNPYYDNAGGKTFLISYSIPINDTTNETVGVISADISLDTLASIVRNVRFLFPNSFCTLMSNNGTLLVAPPASFQSNRKHHVFTKAIEDKNMTLSITIYDADMYRTLHLTTLFFAVMALTGIFSVFFISYRYLQKQRQLNEVRIKEQHIEDELAIARGIQQSLLPSNSVTHIAKNYEIKGLQIPARYVGGDIFDYYVRDNKLLFCIGDVSGKGVPAALLMAISHSLFRTLSALDDQPDRIMESLNGAISDNNPDIMFITMFLGILDLSSGIIRYCNAGHNPPILIKNGHAEYLNTEPSLLMGVDTNAQYVTNKLTMAPGDTLFLYTDGLTEAENRNNEIFGEQQTLETASHFDTMTVDEQVKQMQQSVQIFVDQADQSDDLTLLAIRRLPNCPSSLTMSNDINELTRLEPFLSDFFENNGIEIALLSKLDLALEEALANVIMYAYPEGQQGEVNLTVAVKSNSIHMDISDHGTPFNPLQHCEDKLDVPLDQRKIGGLGIHLIKEIMDSIEYEYVNGNNVLKMEYQI